MGGSSFTTRIMTIGSAVSRSFLIPKSRDPAVPDTPLCTHPSDHDQTCRGISAAVTMLQTLTSAIVALTKPDLSSCNMAHIWHPRYLEIIKGDPCQNETDIEATGKNYASGIISI
jgi:hypothetical protein